MVSVGLLVAFAVLGPIVASHGPFESDFVHGVGPDLLPSAPSWQMPLGADRIFRDVFARLAVAARLSLLIALSATALASAIGAAVGIAAGYFEGQRLRVSWPAVAGTIAAAVALSMGHAWLAVGVVGLGVAGSFLFPAAAGLPVDVDATLMRTVDVLLAFPFLLLVMGIGAALERTSAVTIFVTLGVTGWLGIARLIRAKTLQVRAQEYVVASRALGQTTPRILVGHVVPNVAGPLVVSATALASQMIVADAALSYLGVGIAPPTPTWGRMLFEGQSYVTAAPWLVLAPAVAILIAAWGFTMLGEGLRDALDPR
jgi:ABC-type dipeptide/oligopeptide/nickel transport system permease subunit